MSGDVEKRKPPSRRRLGASDIEGRLLVIAMSEKAIDTYKSTGKPPTPEDVAQMVKWLREAAAELERSSWAEAFRGDW